MTMEEIRGEVLRGHALIWVIWDEAETTLLAAGTTKLIKTRAGKVCLINSLAGRDLYRWRDFLEQIERYARDEGCVKVRIYGRPGWERLLPGYVKPWVTIEKVL